MKKDNLPLPKVSMVLPVYNGEKFLDKSISSALNQTFKDFEFIIINDGSTDNSLKIIKNYQDKRIILIKNKKNKGSVAAYNLGLKNSKGKYIAICTQDDIFHPKRIEREFQYLEKHPHIFLVGSSAIYIDEHGKEIRRFRKYEDSKLLRWRLRKSNSIIFPSLMFRNKDVSFDNLHEYHLYYKLLKRGEKLINIPDFLVKYRVHSNAESIFDKENQKKLSKEVVSKFEDLEDTSNLLDKFKFFLKLSFHHLRTFKEKKIL